MCEAVVQVFYVPLYISILPMSFNLQIRLGVYYLPRCLKILDL